MKSTGLVVLFLFICVQSVFADAGAQTQQIKGKILEAIRDGKSLKSTYQEIDSKYGQRAVASLEEISKDSQNNDQTRWAALFGLGQLSGKESLGFIKKFMTDASWMLRDAALKTTAALGAREMTPYIEQRLQDSALIVRTTAVQAIRHLQLKDSAPKLVDALFDNKNYNNGKPLWIQKHILGTLSEFEFKPAAPKLVELLEKTKDQKFQGQIVAALEKITGKSFKDKPMSEQIYFWKRNALSEMTF